MSTKDTILRRVRALLDKADSTTFTEEADSLRRKADDLMLKHAIDEYELDKARQAGSERKVRPEVYEWEICQVTSPIKDELIMMAGVITRHARCHGVLMGTYLKAGAITMKAVGFHADLRYAEMLYTSLWVQLSGKLEPKPDPTMSFEDNVAMLIENGQDRKRIAQLMNLEWSHALGLKMSAAYKAWCEANDKPYTPRSRPRPTTYMRNFALGFVDKVDRRLAEMRRKQEGEGVTTGKELVLADRSQEVMDFFKQVFPETSRYRAAQSRFNGKAMARGSDAGSKADLSVGRNVTQGSRRSLPS